MVDFSAKVKAAEKEVRAKVKPAQNSKRKATKTSWKKGQSGSPDKVFKPGQSGNPGGRPKEKATSHAIRQALTDMHPDQKKYNGLTRAQVIAKTALDAAENGDISFLKEVLDRAEGKVPQSNEHTGANGGAIAFMEMTPEENEKAIAALLSGTVEE